MKIKLIERANPSKREEKKWYANPINIGTKDLKAIAKEIAGRSSLTRGDVENVLSNFVDELPKYLSDGFSIKLGEFGTLRLSLKSEGADSPKDFNAHTIKPNVVFTPGKDIKEALNQTVYEKDNTELLQR